MHSPSLSPPVARGGVNKGGGVGRRTLHSTRDDDVADYDDANIPAPPPPRPLAPSRQCYLRAAEDAGLKDVERKHARSGRSRARARTTHNKHGDQGGEAGTVRRRRAAGPPRRGRFGGRDSGGRNRGG